MVAAETVLICRFFAGVAGAASQVLVPASVQSLYTPQEMAVPFVTAAIVSQVVVLGESGMIWAEGRVVGCDRHLSSDLYLVSPEGVLAWNLECGGLIKDSVIIGPLIGNYVVQYTGNWRIINWVMVSPPCRCDDTYKRSNHTYTRYRWPFRDLQA